MYEQYVSDLVGEHDLSRFHIPEFVPEEIVGVATGVGLRKCLENDQTAQHPHFKARGE